MLNDGDNSRAARCQGGRNLVDAIDIETHILLGLADQSAHQGAGCAQNQANAAGQYAHHGADHAASNRALAWIKRNGIVTTSEYDMSADALKWAARTYVVAAIGSLATLLYYIMIYMGRRD